MRPPAREQSDYSIVELFAAEDENTFPSLGRDWTEINARWSIE